MGTENKIFTFIGALIIIGSIVILVWHGISLSQCADACGIRRSTKIQGACHCATETGWERPGAEAP